MELTTLTPQAISQGIKFLAWLGESNGSISMQDLISYVASAIPAPDLSPYALTTHDHDDSYAGLVEFSNLSAAFGELQQGLFDNPPLTPADYVALTNWALATFSSLTHVHSNNSNIGGPYLQGELISWQANGGPVPRSVTMSKFFTPQIMLATRADYGLLCFCWDGYGTCTYDGGQSAGASLGIQGSSAGTLVLNDADFNSGTLTYIALLLGGL